LWSVPLPFLPLSFFFPFLIVIAFLQQKKPDTTTTADDDKKNEEKKDADGDKKEEARVDAVMNNLKKQDASEIMKFIRANRKQAAPVKRRMFFCLLPPLLRLSGSCFSFCCCSQSTATKRERTLWQSSQTSLCSTEQTRQRDEGKHGFHFGAERVIP
jgi:hypothetical protein